MLNDVEKFELETALRMVRLLAECDEAEHISFEWRPGGHPTVTYAPTAALEYISVSFTVQDEAKNG